MLLLIDNYDSFTFNLAHYFEMLGEKVYVVRNDKITIDDIQKMHPDFIVISPGPGRPDDAGITLDCIKIFAANIPILGVCLGHQAIAQAFGARIIHAKKTMHGKNSLITHQNTGIFKNISNPLSVTRYHSLVIDKDTLPSEFIITAETMGDGEIMAIQHQMLPLYGVQFHPEAVLTESGIVMLKHFLALSH